jgi:hypothetical protein
MEVESMSCISDGKAWIKQDIMTVVFFPSGGHRVNIPIEGECITATITTMDNE